MNLVKMNISFFHWFGASETCLSYSVAHCPLQGGIHCISYVLYTSCFVFVWRLYFSCLSFEYGYIYLFCYGIVLSYIMGPYNASFGMAFADWRYQGYPSMHVVLWRVLDFLYFLYFMAVYKDPVYCYCM